MPMILLDETTAVVNDSASLHDALSSNNGIDYVYFDADIQLQSGISIHSSKTSLVLDGEYNGVIHRFTDMNSVTYTDSIAILSPMTITITIQNMNIVGRNYYGIPCVVNNVLYNGVSLTYKNITYTGSQLVHNPYGSARFINCNIAIQALTPAAMSPLHEFAEVSHIEFQGTNVFTKTNSAEPTFRFYGLAGAPPYFKVLADSKLTVDTRSYFMANDATAVAFTVEPNASFTLNSEYGFCAASGQRVASFLVDTNASFTHIRRNDGITGVTMYINGAFTVNAGGKVYIEANYASTQALIRYMSASAALNLNNPKSFVLYNRGSTAAAVVYDFESVTAALDITASQINRWDSATPFESGAGTFSDTPNDRWHRPNWEVFTLRGTATRTATSITYNDFTPEELEDLPSLDSLQLRSTRVLSIGNLPLAVNPIYCDKRPISGKSEPGGSVKGEFNSESTAYTTTICTAQVDGTFTAEPPIAIPYATDVTVSANTPFLVTSLTLAALEVGELTLEDAPILIEMIHSPLSLTPLPSLTPLLPRRSPEDPVTVSDTREPSTDWELLLSVTEPLTSSITHHVLENALVFREADGNLIVLSATPAIVYRGDARIDEDPIILVRWTTEYGLLVHPTAPFRIGEEYIGYVHWDVQEAVEP